MANYIRISSQWHCYFEQACEHPWAATECGVIAVMPASAQRALGLRLCVCTRVCEGHFWTEPLLLQLRLGTFSSRTQN